MQLRQLISGHLVNWELAQLRGNVRPQQPRVVVRRARLSFGPDMLREEQINAVAKCHGRLCLFLLSGRVRTSRDNAKDRESLSASLLCSDRSVPTETDE